MTTEQLARLKAWLATPEGASAKAAIDEAFMSRQPGFTAKMVEAWAAAQLEFEQLN